MNLVLVINVSAHNGEEVDDLMEYLLRIFGSYGVKTELYTFPTASALNSIKNVTPGEMKIILLATDNVAQIRMMTDRHIHMKVVSMGKTNEYYDYMVKKSRFSLECLLKEALRIANHVKLTILDD